MNDAQDTIRVLLLEDDIDDYYIVKQILAADPKRKYHIDRVTAVSHLKQAYTKHSYDILLIDLCVEDSQGLNTLSTIIATGVSAPIVVLTGTEDNDQGEKAIQLGAEDYVPKINVSTALLTRTISYAIERHNLLLDIKKQAEIDALTGVKNRRSFYQLTRALIEQCGRNESNFAAVMIDLDGFKHVNDSQGHAAGDDLLIQVANRLQQSLRESDSIARIGGDEFVVTLTNYTSKQDLEKLLTSKHAAAIEPYYILGSTTPTRIGLSMGVAEWRPGMSSEALIKCADDAMYKSKKNGKNKIIFA
ncbi:MAG: GGDEF domain-containing response regulator [Agarilytica sp.]